MPHTVAHDMAGTLLDKGHFQNGDFPLAALAAVFSAYLFALRNPRDTLLHCMLVFRKSLGNFSYDSSHRSRLYRSKRQRIRIRPKSR